MRTGWRVFPHTSDLGLELSARGWAAFYRAAARGLMALYGLKPGRLGPARARWSFSGETPEDVLVAWLSELIFLIGSEGLVPARIEVLAAGPRALRVEIRGARASAGRPPLAREIKAATYHGLTVARGKAGIRARVILDV